MAERKADVQAHWTRPGVLARIDAALTELGQDPQILTPEILATIEHLHSGAPLFGTDFRGGLVPKRCHEYRGQGRTLRGRLPGA
jgi:hypothetical protein